MNKFGVDGETVFVLVLFTYLIGLTAGLMVAI